jgi:hypothetical protein
MALGGVSVCALYHALRGWAVGLQVGSRRDELKAEVTTLKHQADGNAKMLASVQRDVMVRALNPSYSRVGPRHHNRTQVASRPHTARDADACW